MSFLDTLKNSVIVLDGATGTMIQALELTDADFGGTDYKMLSDLLCFSQPEKMAAIHTAYFEAGANGVETNTFGASPYRLCEYDFSGLDLSAFAPNPYGVDLRTLDYNDFAYYLSRRGAEIAAGARDAFKLRPDYDGRPLYVIGSIGPSNRVVSSTNADLARATFDEIGENFYHQVRGLVDGDADVLLFETQQDILELKAAVFGALRAMKERGKRLPIMAQVTVDQFGKMQIFNTDVHAALVTLAGIGIDVFGINCSIGPDLMEKTVERICRYSPLPVSVLPNAGLPVSENGKTVFKFTAEDMAQYQRKFVETYGVNIIGGCCGTTPAHIRAMAEAVRGVKPKVRTPEPGIYISGPQEAVLLDSAPGLLRFAERLNVRGSAKVRNAVENETGIDHDALDEVVREQVQELGCTVIDVCMDSNTVDTVEALKEVVHRQTTDFKGAMCIDSFQVDALAEAIKVYPGRPIINSVSMEEAEPGLAKIDAVMQACEGHRPLYVGLCTGQTGPGATREEKLELATQIVTRAQEQFGVTPDRLFIDVNCFPLGSESVEGMNFALESLEAIAAVKARFPTVNTTIGVGNLTNGLAKKPYMRTLLTSVFIDEARKRGLDSAIINPHHYLPVDSFEPAHYELGLRAVLDRDMDAFAELEIIAEEKKGITVERRTTYDDLELEAAIRQKIYDGFKDRKSGSFDYEGHTYEYRDRIVLQVAEAVKNYEPLEFINQHLMRAMQELGDAFGKGEVSLPHVLKSADVMREAMGFLERYMRNKAGIDIHSHIEYKGTVVLGTVYQDVHSIGKDLAKTLLENYGYRVIDLGTMTPLQRYIDVAKEEKADAIGMSALLVQTSNHMITVSKMMQEQGLDIPVLIGGAPVSDRHAAFVAMAGREDQHLMRPDVFYCRSAMDGVNMMNALMEKDKRATLYEMNKAKLLAKLERAQAKQAEEEELFRTLPRRTVSFDGYRLPDAPRFACERIAMSLRDFVPHIDRRNLYSLNWRFGGQRSREKTGHGDAELDALFEEWVALAGDHGWLEPQAVCGLYPCQAEGDEVVIYDPNDLGRELARVAFTTVIGAGKEDLLNAAQFFRTRESGEYDGIGIQLSSTGPQIDEYITKFRTEGDSESTLYLQGLSDRIAEDLAEYTHQHLRRLLGLPENQGQRWSPGYPGMREIKFNETIFHLLGGGEHLGVQLTDASEFYPTGTTGAFVSFHPEAKYS